MAKKKRFINAVNMRDVIAILILAGLFGLKFYGMDGIVDSSIALVIGYYFSKRIYEEKKRK